MSMYDPLGSAFPTDDPAPWPTTPHSPHTPIPNLPRPSPSHLDVSKNGSGLYGKEPQIYGQPEPGLISPRVTTASNGSRFEKAEPYLRVRITGLDRNRRDILMKLDAQTNLSNFTGTTYRNVSRSYLEFQQFYEAIVHSNPQTIVPALPLPRTSAPTDEEDDRLVKIMLQRWLTRICEDPILLYEEEVRSFIESDFGYQPTPNTRRRASSGFSLVRTRVPDEDEELQRARFELTKLETQYFEAAKAIDKLSRTRKILATVRAEMGNKLVNVATTEAHPPLGAALQKTGRAWHSLADLDQAQGISECVIVGDSLGYQSLNARSAKETLQQRTAVLEEYQAAVKGTISKRRNMERLKASSNIRPERVDEALEEMEEANKYEQVLARRADGISQNLHRALDRHNRLVTEDVTAALVEHVRSSIMYERQLLRELEALRPDVNNAAKTFIPTKSNGAPRPSFVPQLEDFTKSPIPRPASGPPSDKFKAPAASSPPPLPVNGFSYPAPRSSSPFTSSPSTPRSSLPPQSPGAGPSSPVPSQTTFTSPLINGPPLGGRFVDGTKSMFIKPSPSPLGPSPTISHFPRSPALSGRVVPDSPLHAPTVHAGASSPHPLADPLLGRVASPTSHAANGRSTPAEDLDPLGMGKPVTMSSSVRLPTRPRLDAREAASKLANMF
ncbi:Vps5 C terminal like-domain-containing protein [Amylocystis lapponica]|nr:Vps5 C terminal like-domain-containing protein [Amylocystis lapponica]